MAGVKRGKDRVWDIADERGHVASWEQAICGVLMDIRDEMKALNAVFACSRFQRVPSTLDEIERHTRPKKKRPALRIVKRRRSAA